MPECDCGTEITDKNAAGHYREKCAECIRQVANDANRHVDVCEDTECFVCRSWRAYKRRQAIARMTKADMAATTDRRDL